MPFAQHVRLTMSGTVGAAFGSPETFSMRLNLSDPPNASALGSRIDDLVADCSTFFANVPIAISNSTRLTEVKLARIGVDGKYMEDPVISATLNVGGGGALDYTHPYQVALAVSLATDRRGATGRGRFYIPTPNAPVGADGLCPANYITGVRDACQTFLNNVNNIPGPDVIVGRVTVASSKGYNSDVTGVRVGRVLDTIRTRRRSLLETYSAIVPVS